MKEWYLRVCGIWCRSKYKSGSSEFKCGFIRALLGFGRGIYSTECPSTYNVLVIDHLKFKRLKGWGLLSKYVAGIYSGMTVYITFPLQWQLFHPPNTAAVSPFPPCSHYETFAGSFRWCPWGSSTSHGVGGAVVLIYWPQMWRQHPCVVCCHVVIISVGGAATSA